MDAMTFWRRFGKNRIAVAGTVVIVVLILVTVMAPVIVAYRVDDQDLANMLKLPSREHILGTDELGRDLFTRLLYGGRVSLSVGLLATLISSLIGVLVGALAGYFGGTVDNLLMRFVDVMLAFPAIFLLLILFSAIRPTLWTVTLFLGAFGWFYTARIVRAEFLSLREQGFVYASRALGTPSRRLIWRHMLPNIVGPIISATTLSVAANMIAEGTLSYLGFGVPPSTPTWGNMMTSASKYYVTAPILTAAPGVLLFIAILAINFIGDGTQDAFDPRS
jgi:peptide/nickel transport system permease protein